MIETTPQFKRDPYTWLAYGLLGYFAYFQLSSGVVVPFLRNEQGFSYTVGGLHISALALGAIVFGLTGGYWFATFRRGTLLWGSSAGINLGVLALVTGWHPILTVSSMFILGVFGTALLVTVNATLSDKHQHLRAYALTESNIFAATTSAIGPLFIGGMAALGLGWRAGLLLPMLLWLWLVWRLRPTIHVPDSSTAKTLVTNSEFQEPEQRLSALFWAYWVALVLGVSAEWCVVAWSVVFLDDWVGLPSSTAATLYFVLLAAVPLARVAGSALTRRYAAERLMVGTLVLSGAGFLLFWLADVLALTLVGMVITGIGIANIYPMGLSAATGAAAHAIDLGSVRISLGAGLAIMVMPQILGSLADVVGIFAAFGATLGILVLAVGAALYAIRLQHHKIE